VVDAARRSFVVQVLLLALGLVVAITIIGLVSLRPTGERDIDPAAGRAQTVERATVEAVRRIDCRAPGRAECSRVTVEIRTGPDAGKRARFTVGETSSDARLAVGDRIRVYRLELPEGAQVAGRQVDRYGFSDFERGRSLLWLTVLFCALVLISGRFRGLRALVGLGLSLVIVIEFIVPAILDGRSPLGVALVGSLAVMLVTIPLAHGVGAKGLAAMLGTSVSLLLTALLASLATDAVHLTGISSEETTYIQAVAGAISLQGLLLAGMVIGALGVLDDLTVSQSSTVIALRRANPSFQVRGLARAALEVGHDHIAATVNTLVLAYAGASLPVLLIFAIGGTSFVDAVNTEAVADQVVAMLVGSIGLIAAVPVTTFLAAVLAVRIPPDALVAETHGHAH
jgi:uncharacterized membrane protein